MNRLTTTVITIGLIAFITLNCFLLFADNSNVPKSIYVNNYERMNKNDYEQKITKQGIIVPHEIETIYFDNDRTVEKWLVDEGDTVELGTELALLRTEAKEQQRAVWVAEKEALQLQQVAIDSAIRQLSREAARASSSTNTSSSERLNDEQIELHVDVKVDVEQQAIYDQAIADAERDAAQINRQLLLVEAQLAQSDLATAILSPVDGVVAAVNRHAETPTIDIYTNDKTVVTFANQHERKMMKEGNPVQVQAEGIVHNTELISDEKNHEQDEETDLAKKWQSIFEERNKEQQEDPEKNPEKDQKEEEESTIDKHVENEAEEQQDDNLQPNVAKGTVQAISEVPAKQADVLQLYRASLPKHPVEEEPLYAITFDISNNLAQLPYSSSVSSVITINEAKNAAAVKSKWLVNKQNNEAYVWVLDSKGFAKKMPITTPFAVEKRAIVTDGLAVGDVVFNAEPFVGEQPMRVIMPLSFDIPPKEAWTSTSWKTYIKYLLH